MDYLTMLRDVFSGRHPLAGSILSTLLLILVIFILQGIARRAIRRNENLPADVRRRWLVQIRNGAILLLLLGVIVVWADELRMVTASLFAIAVATVIATKELIQCISGSVLKTVSRGFSIGDRIEINNLRGDVIDHNALTTTVMEIGPDDLTQQHTGRAIVLPNCMFLDKPVINETFTDDYVLHVFKVPVPMDEYWRQAEQELLEVAAEQCRPFLEQARTHFKRLGKDRGLTTLSVEPRVTVLIPKTGELELVVRIAVPARKKGRLEQEILRRFVASAVERAAQQKEAATTGNSPPPNVADAA